MAKRITVVKQKRPKRPKRPKKSKKAKKPKRAKKSKKSGARSQGKGQYSSFFPTNRQIDSNQYWQLRAEIAGAEARVRTSLKDRQEDEKKAEKKVEKLEKEVRDFRTVTPPLQRQDPGGVTVNVGTPATPGIGPEDYAARASAGRARRDVAAVSIQKVFRSKKAREGLGTPRPDLGTEDHADRAAAGRASRASSPAAGIGDLRGSGLIRATDAIAPKSPAAAAAASRTTREDPDEILARTRASARRKLAETTPTTAAMFVVGGGSEPDSPDVVKRRGVSSSAARSPKVTLSPQLQEALDRDPGRTPRGS